MSTPSSVHEFKDLLEAMRKFFISMRNVYIYEEVFDLN